MELLAETLRSVRTVACEAERERDSVAARLERAKVIADNTISELPAFLRSVSEDRGNRAYICGLNCGFGFTPCAGFIDSDMPESMLPYNGQTISTPRHCYKYLFGIPRFIALWAVKQGMEARVGFWHGQDSAIFGNEKDATGWYRTRARNLGEGLILSW